MRKSTEGAQAWDDLGLKAWVFSELSDLPYPFYAREAYPNFLQAIPLRELPLGLQEMCDIKVDYRDLLGSLEAIIREWQGERVRIGGGLSNPVWCSDDLLRGAAELAGGLGAPLNFHAEESPLQRKAHRAQWGMSAIQRTAELGFLGPRTLITHVAQVDQTDIALIARLRLFGLPQLS